MSDHLFAYGTLAPGRSNHHLLAEIPGTWRAATVRGWLHAESWGAAAGYPGIVLADEGETVHGFVFSSPDLSGRWAGLDEFEGEGYERVLVTAELDDGSAVQAWIYALRGDASDPSGGS